MVKYLSYIVVTTPALDEWMRQAGEHVGMQVDILQPGEQVRLRVDEKIQRFVISRSDGPATMGMGFEVDNGDDLKTLEARLVKEGYQVETGTNEEIAFRGVADMLHFTDADGVRIEVCHGLKNADTAFVAGRPIGGFRTGDMGLGHVALITEHFDQVSYMYREIFGFKLSDHTQVPFRVEFLHCNPRHHTIGLAHTGGPAKIYHLMLEYNDFDDVGRAYDVALMNPDSIGVTLGRHINDHVTSFYLKNPDGWMLELGWASRTVGPDWEPEELEGMSLWGHDRTWLPDAKREEARQILKKLADKGYRAPVVPAQQMDKANYP